MKRLYHKTKNALRSVRHNRVTASLQGTALRPRLSVFRGLNAMVVQLVDDAAGKTITAAHTRELLAKDTASDTKRTRKVGQAFLVGKLLAAKAKEKGITTVVFDRGGYKYHGRVAAVADGAREGGLLF